jgi:hypothetical protein
MEKGKSVTTYLNVDLDVHSDNVDTLARYLDEAFITLQKTSKKVTFELRETYSNPEQAVNEFIAIIENVPSGIEALWNQSRCRELNVGIKAGREPRETLFRLSNTTLEKIYKVRCDLVFTVYSCED